MKKGGFPLVDFMDPEYYGEKINNTIPPFDPIWINHFYVPLYT